MDVRKCLVLLKYRYRKMNRAFLVVLGLSPRFVSCYHDYQKYVFFFGAM